MAKGIIVVVACIFATSLVMTTPIPSGDPHSAVLQRWQNDTQFETIGQLGKKLFIKHRESSFNWLAGRAICQSAGFQLATLNYDEFRYVSNALIGTNTAVWLSGIMEGVEQMQPRGFVWDTDGTPVGNDINFIVQPHQWLCLYYSGDDHIYTDSCVNREHQTLCQMLLP